MHKLRIPFRMHNTGWILLTACAALGVWMSGWRLGFPLGALVLASLLLHEVGHMLVASILNVPVREFGLRMGGAYTRRAYATRRRDEILISSAGAMMNLLLVAPSLCVPHIGVELALCNLSLCVGNLIPLPASDGLRIVRTIWGISPTASLIPGTR